MLASAAASIWDFEMFHLTRDIKPNEIFCFVRNIFSSLSAFRLKQLEFFISLSHSLVALLQGERCVVLGLCFSLRQEKPSAERDWD